MTRNFFAAFMILAVLLMSCSLPSQIINNLGPTNAPSTVSVATPIPATPTSVVTDTLISGDPFSQARAKIKHIVVIMQENRSFDQYFGTYPGANGFPVQNGQFTVCVNDPKTGKCVYPYHDPANKNLGGPHGAK